MDFFNKLSKKATETYQVAKEKTANVSEEIKLKSKYNSLEEKNYEIFAEIGEIVYNELKLGKDADKDVIMARVDIISANKDEMEKLKAQIRELKNIKVCSKCGTEMDKSVNFCPKCGATQPTDVKGNVEVKQNEPANAKETEVIDVNNVDDKKE